MQTTSLMRPLFFLALALLLAPPLAAQGPVPFDTTANWISYQTGVTTGGAFADLDNDGALDLVVANGNDILRQRVEVYYNDGSGGYPTSPQWQSSDIDYHGHLSVGDVNEDGWPDVAVSVYLGRYGFGDLGRAKVYLNNGAGTLSSNPSWSSSDEFHSFSCAFGDADSDGDLDLAVATGEAYYGAPDRNRIYYNNDGVLATTPGWLSDTLDHAYSVSFGDVDADGDLDLAFCTSGGPNRIFFQVNGSMQTSPGWASTDNLNQDANTLAWRDVNSDGYLDLGVTDNNQLGGGQGLFKIYFNSAGTLNMTPGWSAYGGMVSGINFADIHLDGYPDLGGGIWFGRTRIHLNNSGTFSNSPDWQTAGTSTLEAIFFGDVNGDGLRMVDAEVHPGDGVRRTFYLDHACLHRIDSVAVDGVPLAPSEYCYDLDDGWVALDRAPLSDVTVSYVYSDALDMGVTNWDQDRGNYVFFRYPLVGVTAGPPVDPNVKEGESLVFDVVLKSTENRNEIGYYAAIVLPFFGGAYLIDVRRLSYIPFETKTIHYSIPIPLDLGPPFFGSYTWVAYSVVDLGIDDSDSFVFTIADGP
ncbi:MAG: VCBS repeat-containing protein [Planctomycetota bacterium]